MTKVVSVMIFLIIPFTTLHGPAAAFGQPEQKGKEPPDGVLYVGGSAALPKDVVGVLEVEDDESVKISWEGGRWELPYERIQVLYVSVSRPSAMVELGGISAWFLLAAAKNKKCYLSVQYEEPNARPKKCFFLIRGKSGAPVLETLEKKSKRPVVFESEEARRRVAGRR
jgi:hypothetical protein